MAEVASGREPVTWDQIAKLRPEVTEDWGAMEKYRKEKGIHVH
jgi:dihydropyrimidine dehydrogenase (NAD+) subunit PreA